MSASYTAIQFSLARSLASAHAHGWARSEIPDAPPIAGCLWTHELISTLYHQICERDGYEGWQYGIASPGPLSYSGCVTHETGTGRLQWQIAPDGKVGIAICRPDSEEYEPGKRRSLVVLSARVAPDGAVEIRTPETRDHRIPDVHHLTWSPDNGPRAEARHGDALFDALGALVGRPAALAAIECAGVALSPAPEPAPGWEERLKARARAEGVLPSEPDLI